MRIVRENYPVAELPEDLRAEFPQDATVRVVVEAEAPTVDVTRPSLSQLFSRARPSFRDVDDVADHFASMRAEWD